jgi:hypothetical protein
MKELDEGLVQLVLIPKVVEVVPGLREVRSSDSNGRRDNAAGRVLAGKSRPIPSTIKTFSSHKLPICFKCNRRLHHSM